MYVVLSSPIYFPTAWLGQPSRRSHAAFKLCIVVDMLSVCVTVDALRRSAPDHEGHPHQGVALSGVHGVRGVRRGQRPRPSVAM